MASALKAASPPTLIPLPRQMQTNAGEFILCGTPSILGASTPAPTKILVDGATRQEGEFLSLQLYKSTGFRFQIASNSGVAAVAQAIVITTNNPPAGLGTEGYELTVTTNSVLIRAPTPAGAFYGIQTLLQLLPPEILSPRPVSDVIWSAPCVHIQDYPRFAWRGMMMDSVRHFFNKDEVKQMIDAMTLHKLNTLHWHLDDDSGWRMEIKKWPLLTQIGAWRTNIAFALNPRSSTAWSDIGLYGGYYTQDELREIVAYATQRHITIVPEIEMPGHSTAALTSYPQFSCNSTNGQCPSCFNVPFSLSITAYVGGVFCIARPETMSFLQDVLTEVMDIFPSQFIHIGGDEVDFRNWGRHPLDQALTNSLGLTSSPGISAMQKYQSYFTQQIANWLKSKGRTMIGWSEIMNGGTVTNAALMDWLNTRATQAATNSEYVVMANSGVLYINKWETGTSTSGSGVIWSNEPPGQSGLCTITNVYNYEPIPAGLAAAYTNYILGCEGPAWTEHIPSLQNLQFRVFPRLCAISEVDWTPTELKNFSDFMNRWEIHKQRLAQIGVNFNPYGAPPAVGTWVSPVTTTYSTYSWDITSSVTDRGEIDLSFCRKTGVNDLDIAYVALLENGVEIDRDPHTGLTGGVPRATYVLRLPARRPGATYTIQASMQGHGGPDSNGVIYRTKWN